LNVMAASIWCWSELDTPLGRWLLAGPQQRLGFLGLRAQTARAELERFLKARRLAVELRREPSAHSQAARQLLEYTHGERRSWNLELEQHGTAFDLRVWRCLQAIPYGQTRSYGELASQLGNRGLARAVGGANGRNPLPIVVPCHRVLASSGLGGYSGGLTIKRRLLELEGVSSD
jgi:methylated-DNA-[protein]-cysteine S-methyltransferase